MTLLEIFLIAFGLAMDAFAVSISAGTLELMREFRPAVRLAFHFGWFQFIMPVIGWFIGSTIQTYIEVIDHWIAFALLGYIGFKMIKESLEKDKVKKENPSKGKNLVILSVATSIDALAVGFSMALLNVDIWYPSVIIGVVTGILSFAGIILGNKLGMRFGKQMELIGGIVLIIIGLKILIEHLFIL